MTYRVLIVEDERRTAEMVCFYLERDGFEVIQAGDGPSALLAFQHHQPHLVVADVMLPGFDGLELCRRVRHQSVVPILMLTARSEETDKVIGLGVGADDYLTKPFSPAELVARLKALLRRAYHYESVAAPLLLGGPRLKLYPQRRLTTLDEEGLELTPTEFNLLQTLMTNPGWVFTRSHLLETVWGYNDEAGEETVTTHISNLRRKLGPSGSALIRTVHGVGYIYEEDV